MLHYLSSFTMLCIIHITTFISSVLCSEQKCVRSKKYAAENGLPVLNNVLLPKAKGFCACLEDLRGSLDAGCIFFCCFLLMCVCVYIYIYISLLLNANIPTN